MHTNNGPFHALSYRQRSARQKKRSQKKDFDKGLVQLHKQRAKLWADRQNLPWIPLVEPYQKGWKSKWYTIRYAYTEPWRFVLQIRPHMITEVKMVDAQLEQEIKHLDNYLTTHHLEHRIRRLTNGRSRRSWKSYDSTNGKDRDPFKNKPRHAILDACREEEID